MALTGLVTWIRYLVTAAEPVAWLAVGLLVPGIGMGITTVTLWTPYPRPPGADQPGQAPPGQAAPGQAPPVLAPPAEKASGGRLPTRRWPGRWLTRC